MRFFLAVLAVAAVAVPLAAQDAPALSGKWQIHQSVMGNESELTCTFTQTKDEIAGRCEGSQSGSFKMTGKVAEKKVTLTANLDYNGQTLTLSYAGALEPGKLSGTFNVDPFGVQGEFTGAPVK